MSEQPDDANTKASRAALVKRCLKEIQAYERTFQPWTERGKKIVDRYAGKRRRPDEPAKMNILWSNVETLIPATFARVPQPEVSRRFKDHDPTGRVAALMLERCLEYEVQQYDDYASGMRNAVKDRFLPGRGVCWVRYEPKFRQEAVQVSEDAEPGATVDVIDYECTPVDYVHWKDFGHSCARTWEELKLVWRKVYMGYDELEKRFGKDVAMGTPLDTKPSDLTAKDEAAGLGRQVSKATIYELWDKDRKEVIWLSKARETALDIKPDPLELPDFFPCPRALLASLTTDSLIPIPDFTIYQDQADELDLICSRIDGLIKALKVVGVYDASSAELRRLLDEGFANQMIPVQKWTGFTEKGGLKGAVDFLPIDQVAAALLNAYEARDQIKAQIYELTGISDIIRGQSKASETATAQELKGRYASLRLRKMQEEVAKFAAEVLKLKAHIICTKYQPETIIKMSGAEQLPEAQKDPTIILRALELLKDNPTRQFRIEITSDSLTETDEEAEKQARVEFLTATGAFIEKAVQAAQFAPELMPLLGELLMFGVRGFKVGRSIEGAFDQAMSQMAQPKPPKPNPEVELKQQELAMKQQEGAQRLQMDQARGQHEAMLATQKTNAEIARDDMKAQHQMDLENRRFAQEEQMARLKLEADISLRQADQETNALLKSSAQKADQDLRAQDLEARQAEKQGAEQIQTAIKETGEAVAAMQDAIKGLEAISKAKRKLVFNAKGDVEGIDYEGIGMRKVEMENGEITGMGAL
jgi:hypothetical protein